MGQETIEMTSFAAQCYTAERAHHRKQRSEHPRAGVQISGPTQETSQPVLFPTEVMRITSCPLKFEKNVTINTIIFVFYLYLDIVYS